MSSGSSNTASLFKAKRQEEKQTWTFGVKNGRRERVTAVKHCNLHYEGFVGPSRKSPNRIPEYFARPSSSAPVKKKRRVLQRTNREEGQSSSGPSVEESQVGSQSVSDSEVLEAADVLGSSTGKASTSCWQDSWSSSFSGPKQLLDHQKAPTFISQIQLASSMGQKSLLRDHHT